ncbi:hypothetical protein FKM82_030658, partial [Ascaphus truei]
GIPEYYRILNLQVTSPLLMSGLQVPVEFCRYMVGSIVSEGEEKPLPDHVRIFRKHGFKFCAFPDISHAVMATFPYTTPFSIQLATTRVHPALESYVKVT